ncbi:MAG: hypothetical protein E7554_10590 [Ruminococcaceae bacterium]|nr:hypothetical protein [Oscillospiraceae bacterium]
MSNYIVKIDPDHMPRLIECGELTNEYIQTCVEGEFENALLNGDLRSLYPNLRMLVNEDRVLFDLPFNRVSTQLHDCLRGPLYGTAIMVIEEDNRCRPLTEAEAADIREKIENLYDIEFEEGEE